MPNHADPRRLDLHVFLPPRCGVCRHMGQPGCRLHMQHRYLFGLVLQRAPPDPVGGHTLGRVCNCCLPRQHLCRSLPLLFHRKRRRRTALSPGRLRHLPPTLQRTLWSGPGLLRRRVVLQRRLHLRRRVPAVRCRPRRLCRILLRHPLREQRDWRPRLGLLLRLWRSLHLCRPQALRIQPLWLQESPPPSHAATSPSAVPTRHHHAHCARIEPCQ